MAGPLKATPAWAFSMELVGNTVLALLKVMVGLAAGSRALVADGWHSFSDVAVGLATWGAHRFSLRPPDQDHHYGHGRAEALAGAGVGLVLLGGGVWVGVSAWTSEAVLQEGPAFWGALAVAVASVAGNLFLAWFSHRVGRSHQSQVLLALSRDDGSDALSSVLVVAGLVGSRIGWTWAEPVVGTAIGCLIVWMGWHSVREGVDVLMDRVDDPELRAELERRAAEVMGVKGVQSVRIHPLGARVRVDMEISVDGELTVEDGHAIAHRVEAAVTGSLAHVEEVHVHVNPWLPPGPGIR